MGYWQDKLEDLANPDRPEELKDVDFVPEKEDWPEWAAEDDFELTGRTCPICLTGRIFKKTHEREGDELRCENSTYGCEFDEQFSEDED